MIDLHTHSTASDGSLSPRELARAGKAAGLDVMALTDHDCAKGVDDFLDECAAVGLVGVPGIELSAEVPQGQLHLVGLAFDPHDPALTAKFAALNQEHLFLEGTQFNRGTFYFRVPEWTQAEMEARCLPIAERSIYYYFSKYGKQAFVP